MKLRMRCVCGHSREVIALKAAFGVTFVEELRQDIEVLFEQALERPGGAVGRGPQRYYVEIHPETAARLAVADGERVRVVSRRGEGIFPVLVVRTIRADTIFIPYHWGEQLAVNQLTNPVLDPTSKIPEFKACAARVEKIRGRELPILGRQRRGAESSSVTRLRDGGQ